MNEYKKRMTTEHRNQFFTQQTEGRRRFHTNTCSAFLVFVFGVFVLCFTV